jgi:membrane protein implicated in regulation of membrane protease activity
VAAALGFLFAWGNAPFAIAAGVFVAFTLLQLSGILGLLGGGAEDAHQADHDVDCDAEHDVGSSHEGEHASDEGDAHESGEARASLASILGFGTLPFSLIWETFAIAAALTGYALNLAYLGRPGGPPLWTLAWSLPAATLAGGFAAALLARSLGPVLASKRQEATSRAELIGQIGVVISSRVSDEFGEVRIRDKTGHDIRVVCKLAAGVRVAPAEHDRVVVVDCDEGGGLRVEPLDDDTRAAFEKSSG